MQKRDDGAMTFEDAMYFARWHTAVGAIVAVIAWKVSLGLLAWMAPVILGLLVAGPVTWLSPVHAWHSSTASRRQSSCLANSSSLSA